MRNIDWEAPLSADDELWLNQRLTSELVSKIARNRARFGDGEDLDPDTGEDEEVEDYTKWTSGDLKEEAAKRKLDISGMKKKAEVALALAEDDKARKAAEAEEA